MVKLIETVKWEATQTAVCLLYADASSDLGNTIENNGKTLTISKGSLAYLANGNVYVKGETWTKIGA